MPEFRRYPKGSSRQIIDLNQIQDVMGDEVIICLDVGVLAIIRKLLVDRGLWRTTYAVSNEQFGYSIPTEEEFHDVKQLILAFLEDTQDMSNCGLDIRAGLEAIAAAIANKQCCPTGGVGSTGTGGSGAISDPPTGTTTGQPGNHEGDPPTGFETWEDYDAYKCAVATQIVADWAADLARLQTVIFTTALSTEAVAALIGLSILSPIPGDEIIVIVGITVAAITVGLVSEAYGAAADLVATYQEQLICALYSAADVPAAISLAEGIVENGITAEGYSEFPASFVRQLANSYMNPDNLNRLFDKDTTRTYTGGDCSGCGVVCPGSVEIFGDVVTDEFDPETGQRTLHLTAAWDTVSARYEIGIDGRALECVFDITAATITGWNTADHGLIGTYGNDVVISGIGTDTINWVALGDDAPYNGIKNLTWYHYTVDTFSVEVVIQEFGV